MSGIVPPASSRQRRLPTRGEVVAALQRDPGLLHRCAATAGLPDGACSARLLENLERILSPPFDPHDVAPQLRAAFAGAGIDLMSEPTASTLEIATAARPAGMSVSGSPAGILSDEAMPYGGLCTGGTEALRQSLNERARLSNLCALLAAEATGTAAAATTPPRAPSPTQPPGERRPARAPTPPTEPHRGASAGEVRATADSAGAADSAAAAAGGVGDLAAAVVRWSIVAMAGGEGAAEGGGEEEAGGLACAVGSSGDRHRGPGGGGFSGGGSTRSAAEQGTAAAEQGAAAAADPRWVQMALNPMVEKQVPEHPLRGRRSRENAYGAPSQPGGGGEGAHGEEQGEERLAAWRREVERGARGEEGGREDRLAADPTARFAVGERVECRSVLHKSYRRKTPRERLRQLPERWASGRVTQVRPPKRVCPDAVLPAYQVLLCDGLFEYVMHDHDAFIRRDKAWESALALAAERAAGEEAEGLCVDAKGFAVLTAEEVEALLSEEGLSLLRDAAEVAGLTLGAGCRPWQLLCGCVVRRRAAVLLPDAPLYSPARIREVLPPSEDGGTPPEQQWRLRLTAIVDGVERHEPPAPLRFLSNDTGGAGDEERAVAVCARAVRLGRALSVGEGARRLDRLVRDTARSGIAAIDKWSELLHEEGVYEDEPVADDAGHVIVGEWSAHANIYARMHGARAYLFELLSESDEHEHDAAVAGLAKTFDTWHSTRRKIAHAWLRWLLGLEQRRAGYPALDEFLAHEAALPPDEHIARDDAGRFSLARGGLYFLDGPAGILVEDGLMASGIDPAREACPLCSRAARSCTEWVQLQPCRHWLCGECLGKWRSAAERSSAAPSSDDIETDEPGGAAGGAAEMVAHEELEVGGQAVASLGACPVCRATVVGRSIHKMRWDLTPVPQSAHTSRDSSL